MQMKDIKAKIKDLLNTINNKLPIKITKNRIIILLLVLCIALPIGVGKIKDHKIEQAYQEGFEDGDFQEVVISDSITVTEASLMRAMAPIAELTTYEYAYANWDMYEKDGMLFNKIKIPFSYDKTIFAYSGKITAGIKDATSIKVEVDNDNKKIHVYLPEPVILHNEFSKDNFKTFDYKNSIFVSTSLDEFNEFENKLKQKEAVELIEKDEFWNGCKINTENVISGLFAPLLPEDYIIEYHWN